MSRNNSAKSVPLSTGGSSFSVHIAFGVSPSFGSSAVSLGGAGVDGSWDGSDLTSSFVADSSVVSVFTSPFGGGAVPGRDSAPLGAGVAGPDDDVGVGALGISAREGVGVVGAGGVGAGDGWLVATEGGLIAAPVGPVVLDGVDDGGGPGGTPVGGAT